MTLDELITALEAAPQDLVVPHGFNEPHSYRGYYHELAFEPARNVTVASMLKAARSAHGATFHGYKGGEYTMTGDTDCWLSEYGRTGETLGPTLIRLMLDAGHSPTPIAASAKATVLAELYDLAEDGEIPGTAIRHEGEQIWLHTTGQVTGWLHTLLDNERKTTSR